MDYSLLLCIERKSQRQQIYSINKTKTHYTLDSILYKRASCQVGLARRTGKLVPKTLESQDFALILKKKHSFKSKNCIYHIAIIDYLQEWNLKKQAERLIKTKLMFKNGNGLSAIEPVDYSLRFYHFMQLNVFY